MEKNLPCPIVNENDLKFYESHLNSCRADKPKSQMCTVMPQEIRKSYMPDILRETIGKVVRIESLVGGCLESRIGTLIKVGADYVVLKLYQSCSTMICEASSIKYVTVIHDNDINKIGLF